MEEDCWREDLSQHGTTRCELIKGLARARPKSSIRSGPRFPSVCSLEICKTMGIISVGGDRGRAPS